MHGCPKRPESLKQLDRVRCARLLAKQSSVQQSTSSTCEQDRNEQGFSADEAITAINMQSKGNYTGGADQWLELMEEEAGTSLECDQFTDEDEFDILDEYNFLRELLPDDEAAELAGNLQEQLKHHSKVDGMIATFSALFKKQSSDYVSV